MKNNLLQDEYDRCLRNIIQASNYISQMADENDIEKVDLYRSFLHTMVDKAIQLKKLINANEYKY